MARTMRRFAKWHIWLGWVTGVPLLLWCASGLVMVARPIEEVRGTDRRIDTERAPLRANPRPVPIATDGSAQVVELRSFMQRGRAITLVTMADGRIERHDAATGGALPPVDANEARAAATAAVRGGDKITGVRLFDAAQPPADFRQPIAAWQVTLADGTRVYVRRDSGEVAAVRTQWWRIYDFFWGLHIMDLETREDSHHPTLILFAALALVGSILGTTLLFRRRKAGASRVARP